MLTEDLIEIDSQSNLIAIQSGCIGSGKLDAKLQSAESPSFNADFEA